MKAVFLEAFWKVSLAEMCIRGRSVMGVSSLLGNSNISCNEKLSPACESCVLELLERHSLRT